MGQCTDVGWEFPPTNNFTGTEAKANAIQIYRKPILIFDPRKRRRKEEVLFTLTHTMIANWHIRSTTCLLQSIMAISYWPTKCVQWCVSCPCCVALHWRKCSRYTEYISLVNRSSPMVKRPKIPENDSIALLTMSYSAAVSQNLIIWPLIFG